MQTELADRLAVYATANAPDLVKLKRWLNMGYQYVCSKMNWPFLIDYEIVQTVTDITTGTVSINAADTALTFSSGPAASVANRYIQFSTSDDWYKITAHTAAATTATISPAYVGSSNLSAGTYTVRKLLYASTTPFVSYLDMKKTVNPGQMESLNPRLGEFFLPLYLGTGTPTDYIIGPLDSSAQLQFSLVPPPSDVINLLVRGRKAITELSADSDVPVFPATWHDICVDMGAYYGLLGIKGEQAKVNFDLASIKIADMARVYNTDLGRHRVMASFDVDADMGPAYTLPGSYGRMYP